MRVTTVYKNNNEMTQRTQASKMFNTDTSQHLVVTHDMDQFPVLVGMQKRVLKFKRLLPLENVLVVQALFAFASCSPRKHPSDRGALILVCDRSNEGRCYGHDYRIIGNVGGTLDHRMIARLLICMYDDRG